ncbi:MAG: hypothetical protein U0166_25455 [Acidobacteriota bacterium]
MAPARSTTRWRRSPLPYLVVIETVTIFLPLLYHGVYGLFISYQGKPNPFALGYPRNWMYTLQA